MTEEKTKALSNFNPAETAKSLISLTNMPKDQIKRAMDENYLQMLVAANPLLDKQHFVEFITKCQLTGADPRLNQIYLIVHDSWNSQTQKKEPKGTTVFSYQFFIRLAQQTGQLEDFDVDIIEEPYLDIANGKKKHSLTAKAWVKRKGQGKFNYKARLWEFAKTTKDGQLMGNWKASPYLMLEKCAVANVMRWAFPEVLGNLYVADEMERATGSTGEARPTLHVEPSPQAAQATLEQAKEEHQPEPSPLDSVAVKSDADCLRDEILDYLDFANVDWVAKIGKGKEALIEKVKAAEGDLDKMRVIHEFVMKVAEGK